jgi:hypothetical protein
MGIFDRWRTPADAPWQPPAPGACACQEHVENLRDHPAGEGPSTVGTLLDSGALTAELAGPEPGYVELPLTGQRLGPFHWRARLEGAGRDLYVVGAPAALDDCLSLQAGVDRVVWPDHKDLLVGAPTLCASGVMAALVRALDNPRVRRES